jgi:hypothetical protein
VARARNHGHAAGSMTSRSPAMFWMRGKEAGRRAADRDGGATLIVKRTPGGFGREGGFLRLRQGGRRSRACATASSRSPPSAPGSRSRSGASPKGPPTRRAKSSAPRASPAWAPTPCRVCSTRPRYPASPRKSCSTASCIWPAARWKRREAAERGLRLPAARHQGRERRRQAAALERHLLGGGGQAAEDARRHAEGRSRDAALRTGRRAAHPACSIKDRKVSPASPKKQSGSASSWTKRRWPRGTATASPSTGCTELSRA